jgi:hypothetical protein
MTTNHRSRISGNLGPAAEAPESGAVAASGEAGGCPRSRSWAHTRRGTSRRCGRSCRCRCRRWGRSNRWRCRWIWSRGRGRSRRRCCWRCYSRRGSRCRCPRWHLKSKYFVIGTEVDPTTGDQTRVPLARAGHLLVSPAAGKNDSAIVAIVTMQSTIAFNASHPDNCIVSAVSRCDPRRTSAAVIDVPAKSHSRRTCRINYIRAKFAASL